MENVFAYADDIMVFQNKDSIYKTKHPNHWEMVVREQKEIEGREMWDLIQIVQNKR